MADKHLFADESATFVAQQERAKLLLADPCDGLDDPKKHELLIAAKRGHHRKLKRLIDEGADLEVSDLSDTTALGVAAFFGHIEGMHLLIKAGANLEHEGRKGRPLEILILGSGNHDRYIEGMHLLIRSGASIQGTGSGAWMTPLLLAARFGKPDAILTLVAAGADLDAVDNGKTVLDLAQLADEERVESGLAHFSCQELVRAATEQKAIAMDLGVHPRGSARRKRSAL